LGAIVYGWLSLNDDHMENPLAKFKVDKVSRQMSALKKISRAPAILPKEAKETKSFDPVGQKDFLQADNPLLIQLTRQLQRINKSCEKVAEDIFQDNNYIDPQFELYGNPEKILKMMGRVFNEMLVHKESLKAFTLLKSDIEKSPEDGVAPATWDKVLRNIDVCRENEIFYFFETLFESFRYDHIASSDKKKIVKTFIMRLKDEPIVCY
jgi:hypothetical protein